MDPRHFDSLVRKLGLAISRRGALAALLAGLAALRLPDAAEADRKKGRGASGRGRNNGKADGRGKGRGGRKRDAVAAQRGGACRGEGHPCEGNQRCCENLVCIVSGPAEAERCTPCGAAGLPCCAAETCGSGAICQDGECVGCGAGEQPCCADESCDDGFVCDGDGECAPCGSGGELCCDGGTCASGFNCDGQSCAACGDEGLDCCDAGDACGDGQICTQGGECAACGGADQPCCAAQACDGGFVCDAGECVPCGEAGQACCDDDDDPCGGGLTCDDDGVCRGCGGEGETCCNDGSCGENLVCNEGTCAVSCDDGDVICVIGGNAQCVPGICCEEGEGPGCGEDETCIAGGCINENQFRVVLRWSAEPRDLDSHLWLPEGANQFHVFWNNKGALGGPAQAELDIDDITGFGPETITIGELYEGTYLYAVHHYTGDGTIGTSGAQVELYQGPTLLRTYSAPVDAPWDEQVDVITPYNDGVIWWKLFELNYDGTTVAITDYDAATTYPSPYGTGGALRGLASQRAGEDIPLKSRVSGGNTARRRSRKAGNRRRDRR